MKVLLNICGVGFIAKDAASAAKVADLLGSMQAVSREYLSTGSVLVLGRDRSYGGVDISEIGEVEPMGRKEFAVKKKADREAALKAEAEAASAKAEGGAK